MEREFMPIVDNKNSPASPIMKMMGRVGLALCILMIGKE